MDIYNGKLYFRCDKCGKDFQASKYLYRINFEELDTEEFRPFGCIGSQVCYSCWKKARDFVCGGDRETLEVTKKPTDKATCVPSESTPTLVDVTSDWELFLKLKKNGVLDGFVDLMRKEVGMIETLRNYYDKIKDKYEDSDGIKAKYVKHELADILGVDKEKY